ncbi:MAG TPA: DUF2207 domain-containing protein [Candidatus Saccharimonadales bacterium]|nr:DUF2207 domain-containing protein [Candidatus Saccharimonadales bacterium]
MRSKMVRIGAWAASLFVAVSLFAVPARAQDTQNFVIRSFHSDYHLSRDSQNISKLKVTEKIIAEFPAFDQNHGIIRALPLTYQGHDVNLKLEKVVDAGGNKIKYTTEVVKAGNMLVKIGDANKYVHGLQEYDITYTIQNVIAKFSDHDELFWDVNGDDWKQPTDSVTATLHIPKDIATELKAEQRCYTGTNNSTQADCTITRDVQNGDTVINAITTRGLAASETLTYVIGFNANTFVGYQVPLSQILWWAAGIILLGLTPPVFALWVVIRKWRQYGRDAKGRGTIVPQYVPPKELSVLGSSEVLRQRFVSSSVSAQILDLAVRRCLKIYEQTEKKVLKDRTTYSVELTKTTMGLRSEEKAVVAMLFGGEPKVGDKVDLSDLSSKLYKKAADLGKTLDQQLASEGYFLQPPQKVFQMYLTWGIVLCVVGFIFPPYTLGMLLAGIVVLASSRLMPARTQKGVDMRDYLYGLRDYMKMAEVDRIRIMQSPKGQLTEKVDTSDSHKLVKLYEKLLPYAMLFGIEKEWAKQFADLYYEKQPDWYHGSGAFNAVYFAGAVHGFSSSSNATFSPPSSSGSSGFSGGGAGGGGGGGGGGGW